MNGHLHMHSELSTIIGNYWDCEKFVILGLKGGVSIRLRHTVQWVILKYVFVWLLGFPLKLI